MKVSQNLFQIQLVASATSGGQFDSISAQSNLNMEFQTQNQFFDGIELRLFKGHKAVIGYRASSTLSPGKSISSDDFFRIGKNKLLIKK